MMVAKGDDVIVVWPRYFDASLSRAQGRRVAKDVAVSKPDAGWVLAAAKTAGFSAEKEEKATHPAVPYESVGRVLVKAKGAKEEALAKIAAAMKATQPEAAPARGKAKRKRGKR